MKHLKHLKVSPYSFRRKDPKSKDDHILNNMCATDVLHVPGSPWSTVFKKWSSILPLLRMINCICSTIQFFRVSRPIKLSNSFRLECNFSFFLRIYDINSFNGVLHTFLRFLRLKRKDRWRINGINKFETFFQVWVWVWRVRFSVYVWGNYTTFWHHEWRAHAAVGVVEHAVDTCCICLEPMHKKLYILECTQRFHAECGLKWVWTIDTISTRPPLWTSSLTD